VSVTVVVLSEETMAAALVEISGVLDTGGTDGLAPVSGLPAVDNVEVGAVLLGAGTVETWVLVVWTMTSGSEEEDAVIGIGTVEEVQLHSVTMTNVVGLADVVTGAAIEIDAD
jgi:hypothetical protein